MTFIIKYYVNLRLLEEWRDLAQIWGLSVFKSKPGRCKFSSVLKFKVVKYYLNHHGGFLKVAARFKLSYSNVWQWTNKFKRYGALGLKPARKGECRIRRIHAKTKQNYEHKIAKLQAENKGLKLDKLILKTLARVKRQTAKKTRTIALIRANHPQYLLKDILAHIRLKRHTFYYEWAKIQKPPKYWRLRV